MKNVVSQHKTLSENECYNSAKYSIRIAPTYKFHKNSKRDYAWFIGLQDGEVSVPEFIKAIDQQCKGKGFDAFPEAFKFWINCSFRTIDVDGESDWYIHVKTFLSVQQYFILSSLFIQ